MNTRISHPPLPFRTQQVADVIGRERALYLVSNWKRIPKTSAKQGERICIYIPATLPADHELVRVMGWSDAEKLVRAFRGEILHLSTCADVFRAWRNDAINAALNRGETVKKVADDFKLTPNAVRHVVKSPKRKEVRPA